MSVPPPSPEPDLRIGTTLDGRYRLVRRLGAGGFGVVYEAEHEVIRRKVAVKMLHASFAAEPEVLARFRREAVAATTIGHPHIVEVLDMGRADDGAAYMVLELLEGRDWAAVLEESGPQPLGRTIHILLQILDGLAAAHDKGIIHRDLKAENVFLITRGTELDFVKIVDFGISKIMEEGGTKDVVLTHTGMAMGTPVAMSPEQFQGKKDVDPRADLWAVGVMLYRALAAQWPFGGNTYAMLAVNVMTEHPRPLAELRPDVPRAVTDAVGRLLEKDRARRFQSAREVRAALEPFEADRTPAPTGPLGIGLVSTRVGVSTPSVMGLAVTGRASDSDSAGMTSQASAPATTAGPGGSEASAARPALSPTWIAAALLAGTLLVAGTWWLASSPSGPTTEQAQVRASTPGPDAREDDPDAALRAAVIATGESAPDEAPATDEPIHDEPTHDERIHDEPVHAPLSRLHVRGGHARPNAPEATESPAATEPAVTTPEPAPPAPPATSAEPPVTAPPATSRPGLRRPG